MGLLDDAIREHLELKRQHGAGEEEVRRQEQEALGPPRRGEVPEPLAPPEDSPSGEPVESADVEAGAGAEGADGLVPAESGDEPAALAVPEYVPPPAVGDAPPAAGPETAEEEVWLEQPDEPTSAAYAAPEAVPERPLDPASDDVLEETPEFLQETPEHDRLWFEQKPPKDFDFDP